MTPAKRSSLIILSIINLLVVLFAPIYSVWGGLFPSEYKNFFDVVELIDRGDTSLWVVHFSLSIMIPTVCMLIFFSGQLPDTQPSFGSGRYNCGGLATGAVLR